MIRRKRRAEKASDSTALAFSKGTPRWREKDREDADFERRRRVCRKVVFHREDGRCQCCGKALVLRPKYPADVLTRLANVHEEPPRSLGGDPTDPRDCVLLCPPCHDEVTGHRLDVLFRDPEKKAYGLTEFQRRLPECTDHERTPDGRGDRAGLP